MAGVDKSVFRFLELPYEIRHDIYRIALRYPDLTPVFNHYEQILHEFEAPFERPAETLYTPLCCVPVRQSPPMRTPSLLLVNRQITAEALPVLRDTVFALTRLPPRQMTLARPMDITDFIGEGTLRTIRYMELTLDLYGDSKGCRWMVELLLDVWTTGHSLRKLTVWVRVEVTDEVIARWDRNGGQAATIVSLVWTNSPL